MKLVMLVSVLVNLMLCASAVDEQKTATVVHRKKNALEKGMLHRKKKPTGVDQILFQIFNKINFERV